MKTGTDYSFAFVPFENIFKQWKKNTFSGVCCMRKVAFLKYTWYFDLNHVKTHFQSSRYYFPLNSRSRYVNYLRRLF